MASPVNVTVTVPAGSFVSNNQLCTPASWTDILTFYLANYIIHVGSVQFYPGERGYEKFFALLLALLFPTAGVARGLDRIVRCAIRGKTPLEKAALAGALCMVVRAEGWEPADDQTLIDVAHQLPPPDSPPVKTMSVKQQQMWLMEYVAKRCGREPVRLLTSFFDIQDQTDMVCRDEGGQSLRTMSTYIYKTLWQRHVTLWWWYLGTSDIDASKFQRNIYGDAKLPRGYTLSFVPHNAIVKPFEETSGDNHFTYTTADDTIAPSYNAIAGFSSIAQVLFGLATLYNTVGPQIDRFGYAAFGLTVIQFTLMSLINLIGTIVTPAYASAYIVDSEIMQEARARGAQFRGIVGRLVPTDSMLDEIPDDAHLRRFELDSEKTSWQSQEGHAQVVQTSQDTEPSMVGDNPANNSRPSSLHNEVASDPKADEVTADITATGGYTKQVLAYTLSAADLFVREQLVSLFKDSTTSRTRPQESGAGFRTGSTEQLVELESSIICVPSHPPFARSHPAALEASGSVAQFFCWIIGALPLLPVGLLTHFHAASSTTAQRVIVMLWFAIAVPAGAFLGSTSPATNADSILPGCEEESLMAYNLGRRLAFIGFVSLFCAPSIAGYVEVGLMYSSFGTCYKVA